MISSHTCANFITAEPLFRLNLSVLLQLKCNLFVVNILFKCQDGRVQEKIQIPPAAFWRDFLISFNYFRPFLEEYKFQSSLAKFKKEFPKLNIPIVYQALLNCMRVGVRDSRLIQSNRNHIFREQSSQIKYMLAEKRILRRCPNRL